MSLNGAAWIWFAGNMVLFVCEGYLSSGRCRITLAPGIAWEGSRQSLQFSLQRHPSIYTERGQSYWRKVCSR